MILIKNTFALLFFVWFSTEISTQDHLGFWVSSCEIEIEVVNEKYKLQNNTWSKVQLNKPENDTTYKAAYIILNFLSTDSVEINRLSELVLKKRKTYRYRFENGKLEASQEGVSMSGIFQGDQ